MKLYLVERTDEWDYDDYNSFVVSAENEAQARNTSPRMDHSSGKPRVEIIDWGDIDEYGCWVTSPDKLKVTYLGTNEFSNEHKVICASFNAG